MWKRLKRLLGGKSDETPDRSDDARTAESSPEQSGYDFLVLSDFHLGESVKDLKRIDYFKSSAALDREFCDFLEYHKANPPRGGRRWRLIVNGDLLDLLQVPLRPSDRDASIAFVISEDEWRYGLENEEAKSVWKLRRLLERHQQFLAYLADFVANGHRLDIVVGNHDQELYWIKAQTAFRENLVAIYFGDERHGHDGGVTPETLRGNVHFHPWCIYEPGLFWLEHGHQYDPFCSVVNILHPVHPTHRDRLEQPLTYLAIRYVSNHFVGFSTHDKESWRAKDYLISFLKAGMRAMATAARFYLMLMVYLVRIYRRSGGQKLFWENTIQRERLSKLARRFQLPVETIQRIDDLKAKPMMKNLFSSFRSLKLDQVVWVLGSLFCSLVIAVLPFQWWIRLLVLITLFTTVALILKRIVSGEDTDARRKLRRAAFAIEEILDVPLVLLGHSHVPTMQPHPTKTNAYYVNSGCWIAERTHPEKSVFTFVEIVDDPEPRVFLKRWDPRKLGPNVMRRVTLPSRSRSDQAGEAPPTRAPII